MTGIHMAYEYTNCHLPKLEELRTQLVHLVERRRQHSDKPILVAFVGDSVMALQYRNFKALIDGIHGIETMHNSIAGGLGAVMRRLRVTSILGNSEEEKATYVLYNSGLHDILNLCTQERKELRKRYIDYAKWPSEERPFSCTAIYQELMQELRHMMESLPVELQVYQSTNAAWPMYGMLGENRNENHTLHPFSLSPHMVSEFNDLVINNVFTNNANSTHTAPAIMDGFFMTAARPDNREVTNSNALGCKMVHPGIEVVDAMTQVWTTMIIDHLEQAAGAEMTLHRPVVG
jgi:hypothetical protein